MSAAEKIEPIPNPALDPIDAIMAQLHQHSAVEKPINLYEIGPTLVGAGYSQEQLVNALFYLQSMKRIELMDGNRVRVLTSQTSR
ncbi:hypothetical protein [Neorhizobium sp. NCHU2750]|uniref:hypothetical protein n=1 Tax=Neorhizobium sp. NCHU2750 TaxID=1825976 RepID=UPI000EB662E9|nr:hypothetical protein NCHU2750_23350 [Neorhizobium sp. NCHU2750]